MEIQSLAYVPFWVTSTIVILAGLAVGSFLNVVIYRVPREMSIVRPRSRCLHCQSAIRVRDNIPIISYLLLGGRCRKCGERISLRYPVVEIMVAVLFWVVWLADGPHWRLLPDLAFVSAMVALAMIDLDHRLLPDLITYPGFVLAIGLSGLLPIDPEWPWTIGVGPRAGLICAGLMAASGFIMLAIEWLDYDLIGRRLEEAEEAEEAQRAQDTLGGKAAESPSEDPSGSGTLSSVEKTVGHSQDKKVNGSSLWLVTVLLGCALAGIFWLTVGRAPGTAGGGTDFCLQSVLGGMAGAGIGAGMIWLLRIAYFALRDIEGVGFGDVKMMMMVGAYLGWSRAFMTLLLASLIGSLVGAVMVLWTRNRLIGLPYGLFIAVAAIVALLAGTPMLGWYWGFTKP